MSKFPSLEIPPVKRSNKNLSHVNRFSTMPGVLNVCYVQQCVPGDQFKIKPYVKIETLPLKAPLLGRFAVQTDFFFVPFRLYVAEMKSNARKLFNTNELSTDYELPTFHMDGAFSSSDSYNLTGIPTTFNGKSGNEERFLEAYAIKNNNLLNQLGFPIGYMDASSAVAGAGVKADKAYAGHLLLAYYDIFRNYYANTQEENFYVRHASTSGVSADAGVPIVPVSLKWLDDFYNITQPDISGNTNNVWYGRPRPQDLYNKFLSVESDIMNGQNQMYPQVPLQGLCLRTYKPDYFSNWISKPAYDGIANSFGKIITQASGDTQAFTVNQFRLGNRLLKRAEKILASGGRYGDYIRALFTINTNPELDIPEYLGGSLTYLDFQSISSQTGGTTDYDPSNGSYPLGASASKGNMVDSISKLNVTCDDYGYIIGINSIIPTPDYSTGVPREFTNQYLSDYYDPSLDRVGFQAIYKSEFDALVTRGPGSNFKAWFGLGEDLDPFADSSAIAYQPAFMEMETRTNRNYGLLGQDLIFPNGQQGSLNFWTLNRNFRRVLSENDEVQDRYTFDASTYIFPSDYSVSFVDDSFDAQNFIVQYNFDVFAKRPKGKKLMPTIG